MTKKSKKLTQQQSVALATKEEKQYAVSAAKIRSGDTVLTAANVIDDLFPNDNCDFNTLCQDFSKHMDSIQSGNTNRLQFMLLSQAEVLQGVFQFGAARIGKVPTIDGMQAYADLTIKANNAMRKTLLAISQIQNPSHATFVKQQNNAVNQQVNNNKANLEITKKPANELLSEIPHASLDSSRESTTSRLNTPVETLVKSRRKNNRGQS